MRLHSDRREGAGRSASIVRGTLAVALAAGMAWSTAGHAAGTGVYVEYWTGISGNKLSSLTSNSRYPSSPSGSGTVASFDSPANSADSYGARWRAYVVPPTTGWYTFWIAGDDAGELYLSSDQQASNKKRIAYFNSWTSRYQWTKFSSQRSKSIYLKAGQRYYIEALHKEGSGGDHLSVAWQTSGMSRRIISGSHLEAWAGDIIVSPTPAPAPAPEPTPTPSTGTGTGLTGTYFDNSDLTNQFMQRVDPQVNFSWGYGAPASGMGADSFSVRWTGQVEPVHAAGTQAYTFYTTSDDGVRLWVNGQLLIDRWINQSPYSYSATINLAAGQKYDLKLEYFEGSGGAVAKLEWATSGVSRQLIPTARLYPSSTSTTPPPSGTPGDADGDGLPDSWELQHGLNPNDPSDATADKDGDGSTNLQEYQAGSDPTSSASTPTVGLVKLAWEAPVARSDGTPIAMSEIAGYRIRYGTSPGSYGSSVTVSDAYSTSYTLGSLTRGKTYYFVVTALDVQGGESSNSNEVSKSAAN